MEFICWVNTTSATLVIQSGTCVNRLFVAAISSNTYPASQKTRGSKRLSFVA